MIPVRIHRKLAWALNLHDWGWKKDAMDMAEEVAKFVTEENEVNEDVSEEITKSTKEGHDGFGFRA